MEKVKAEQIVAHTNNSPHTLNRMQFGFRKYHSTETAVCFFLENIKSKVDAVGVIGAVFIDPRKVFDTINHKILMTKQNMKPTPWNNSLGIPQGSVLGPLLFMSIYR